MNIKTLKVKFIILLLLSGCTSLNFLNKRHIEKDYYDNGEMKYKIQKFNDKIDGYAKYWDNNGKLINVVNYSNGVLHGEWKEYYSNGKIKYILNYQYGLKDGYERWYYDNGVKKSEIFYKNNKIIIDIIRWDKNGNLIYK